MLLAALSNNNAICTDGDLAEPGTPTELPKKAPPKTIAIRELPDYRPPRRHF
jgi:hypothetical protein